MSGTDWRERLEIDADVSPDSPVVKGTWVTVRTIVSLVVNGWTWDKIMKTHPEIERDDIRAALEHAVFEGADAGQAEKIGFVGVKPVLDSTRNGFESSPIRISSLTYRRLKSFGNFENEAVEATADVPLGTDPDLVLGNLKSWVSDRLDVSSEVSELNYRRQCLVREKRDIEESIAALKDRWEKAKAFLEKHGVRTGGLDSVPF